MKDTVLILDFGSQFTQLIARRVREAGVYCEIVPYDRAEDGLQRLQPKAIILSGGPSSVYESDTPAAPDASSSAVCRCLASAMASTRWWLSSAAR